MSKKKTHPLLGRFMVLAEVDAESDSEASLDAAYKEYMDRNGDPEAGDELYVFQLVRVVVPGRTYETVASL